MNATELLSKSLNRNDNEPNIQLAIDIINTNNKEWVQELIDALSDKKFQNDCIKVLYEIGLHGGRKLISPYWQTFVKLLTQKNNRLIWGAMTALDTIALLQSDNIVAQIDIVKNAVDNGSVITIDGGVSMFAKLASIDKHSELVLPMLIEQLERCPPKQFPQYIEKSVIAFNKKTVELFKQTIKIRYDDLEKDSQRKRVDKVIKSLSNLSST